MSSYPYEEVPRLTLKDKVVASSVAAVVFMLCALPQVYQSTNSRYLTTFDANSCPTPGGKFLHSAVFFAVSYFLMKIGANKQYLGLENKSDGFLAKCAFHSALLFFVLTSTDAFKLTGNLTSRVIANEYGCPNVSGVVAHALVFLVVLVLVMYFPKE